MLARAVARSYEAGPVIAGPDHPYLLMAPDLLAADGGGLVAVFIQHARESRVPSRLLARATLAALALPSHTKLIAVARTSDVDGAAFDAVVTEETPGRIARSMGVIPRSRDRTPPETLQRARQRTRRAWTSREPDALLPDAAPGERPYRAIAQSTDGRLLSDGSRLSHAAAVERLRNLMAMSVPEEFAIDRGAVYVIIDELPVHQLHLDTRIWESRRFDPFKIQRSAAFAGWAMTGVPHEEDFWSDVRALAADGVR